MKRILLTLWWILKESIPGLLVLLVVIGGLLRLSYPATETIQMFAGYFFLFYSICFFWLGGQDRYHYLFRRAESKFHFWMTVFGLCLISISISFFTVFVFLSSNFPVGSFLKSPFDLMWALLLIVSFQIIFIQDIRAVMARGHAQVFIKRILVVMVSYVIFFLGIFLFPISRFLAFAYFEVFFLIIFLFKNDFVLNSFPKEFRKKTFIYALIFLLIFSGISHGLSEKTSTIDKMITNYLQSRSVEEINSISEASQWLRWFESTDSKKWDSKKLIEAFMKLETVCPSVLRDDPTRIICYEKDIEEDALRISLQPAATNLIDFLNSDSEYVKLVGLLKARYEVDFNDEIQKKISGIANSPGILSLVAQVTLKYHGKNQRPALKINLKSVDATRTSENFSY